MDGCLRIESRHGWLYQDRTQTWIAVSGLNPDMDGCLRIDPRQAIIMSAEDSVMLRNRTPTICFTTEEDH